MVWPLAVTPEIEWLFMYAEMADGVAATLLKPWQNWVMPTKRSSKSDRPPNGVPGLQSVSRPRMKSAPVTWRFGVVSQSTPDLIVMVAVMPSALNLGSAVARSGATVVVLPITAW